MNDGTRIEGEACARVEGRLAALFDGALAPLDEARDHGHLEACAACCRAYASHAELVAALRAVGAREERALAAEAAELSRVVRARLAVLAPDRAPRLRIRGRVLGLAAAAAAVLGLALLEWRTPGALRPLSFAGVGEAFAGLPSWSDLVRGLDSLTRSLS
jgi:predicted anti-sigma-YlaC factor YlaD